MARWQRLSDAQIAELFDPPIEQRELVRHFTLSAPDITAIARCRGDSNRLGYAVMCCYLRYPGRALRAGERPPAALIAFVAEQIGVLPESMDDYLVAKRTCWRHTLECQEQLGLRPFSVKAASELESCLLPQAIENDRLAYLAPLAVETCRQRQIVVPSPAMIERFCAELRRVARLEVHRRLAESLSVEQRRGCRAVLNSANATLYTF